MAFGIEIRNSTGRIVIDGSRQNYFLVERRSLSMTFTEKQDPSTAATVFYYPRTVTFSRRLTTQDPPLVFLRHTGGEPISVVKMNGTPGNWYGFDVVTNCWLGTPYDASYKTSSFEYEVYISASDAISVAQAAGFYYSSSYGFFVRDANGRTVFDTRLVTLAITDFHMINTGIPQSQAGAANFDDQQPFESRVLFNIPSNNLVDAFSLSSLFSVIWTLKPFLVGNQVKLICAGRGVRPSQYDAPWITPFLGCQNRTIFPLMSCRRRAL